MNWNGTPAGWPGEYGTIIQADRMQFGGGIFYAPYQVEKPNAEISNIDSLLSPYYNAPGTPQTHYSQYSVAAVLRKILIRRRRWQIKLLRGRQVPCLKYLSLRMSTLWLFLVELLR